MRYFAHARHAQRFPLDTLAPAAQYRALPGVHQSG
jgi:hypothetical protein